MPAFCLGETEEKPTVSSSSTTSGLHKSKYCVMPDPFAAERFGKGSGYAGLSLSTR